jgi:hypothetical protein
MRRVLALLPVYVDPAFPLAWRSEPYLSQLRQWASNGAKSGGRVFVFVKNSLTVILPTKEVELGKFEPGNEVIVS